MIKMEDIVCDGCALLCDDVSIEIDGSKVTSLGFCRLGHTHAETALKQVKVGKQDIEKIAEILLSAENLLLFGWSSTSNETIKEGLAMAKSIGATFDSSANMGLSQSMNHDIHKMKLDCDLEQVRNTGEFIIYWGSNPTESCHRHPSRFAVLPRGDKIPEGVESRTIGVVDVRETETMKIANHRTIIESGLDAELIDSLIADITGSKPITGPVAGVPASELMGFVRALKNSDCTIIFYGTGILNSGRPDANLTSLLNLINTLRDLGKESYALPMWFSGNAMGVIKEAQLKESSLKRLVDGEFDVALVVGEDALAILPGAAAKALANTKLIYIGPKGGLTDRKSVASIHTPDNIAIGLGTMTRIDMVDVELKAGGMDGSQSTSMLDIISSLHKILQAKEGGK
ncbi:MAG: hypothetical protein ACTSV2_18550 [Candidatus Thorarchaeota archaeon]